jgi:DNA replication protein DnaC
VRAFACKQQTLRFPHSTFDSHSEQSDSTSHSTAILELMEEPCTFCGGSGMRLVERPNGSRVAQDCVCRIERRIARLIASAKIPSRYEHCTLESFDTSFSGATRSLRDAHFNARKFIEGYRSDRNGTGLLMIGDIGIGKTHLAVGVLQALIHERGATGLFCHYLELLKQVQNSYNKEVRATELQVLAPVFEAEVLVLDELGASKPTDWVWDTVTHILNTRYNDRLTTIITTNYPNRPSLLYQEQKGIGYENEARTSRRPETLGDRIGDRMRSRLQEMCVVVEMNGVDFRQTVNLARFG